MTVVVAPARRLNVPFLGSFVVVVVSYVLVLSVLRVVVPDTEVAGTLSALVIGAGPRVQRELEQRFPRAPRPSVSMEGYLIGWWVLLIGGIAAIALAEAARIVIELRGGPMTAVSASVATALTLLPAAVALAIGLLAGARSSRWPFLVTVLAIVLGHLAADATSDRVAAFATGVEVLPSASAPQVPAPGSPSSGPPSVGPPGSGSEPPDPVRFYFGTDLLGSLLADELPILVVVGMAGLWWGTRMRFTFYLGRLAAGLSDADKEALASLIVEERDRATPARTDTPPGGRSP